MKTWNALAAAQKYTRFKDLTTRYVNSHKDWKFCNERCLLNDRYDTKFILRMLPLGHPKGYLKTSFNSMWFHLRFTTFLYQHAHKLYHNVLPSDFSRVAQRKRAGPITQRSVDRNHPLLHKTFNYSFRKIVLSLRVPSLIPCLMHI